MTSSDPRLMLQRSFDQAARVVAGVSFEQLDLPTPCAEFDVAALLTHMVGVGCRIAGIGRGESQSGRLPVPEGMDEGGWDGAFQVARAQAASSWADDIVLDRKIELPFGTFTGAAAAQIYTLELTAHAWDLASATDQIASLDAALAEASLGVAQEVLPPEPRGGFLPFEAVVPVPAEAPAYVRLAGYLGRTVN